MDGRSTAVLSLTGLMHTADIIRPHANGVFLVHRSGGHDHVGPDLINWMHGHEGGSGSMMDGEWTVSRWRDASIQNE